MPSKLYTCIKVFQVVTSRAVNIIYYPIHCFWIERNQLFYRHVV